ncbi:MAG: DUF120 domain-containing protein [Candidatus Diapherotrites archaeon]|nr:DUF120 domain-containing protein [Candidatus Diapherotrites archaeon]
MSSNFELLIKIADKNSLYGKAFISTSQLAKKLDLSQQSVSRKLIELENSGLITRKPGTKGINLKLTEKGIKTLKEKYFDLKELFESKSTELTGTLISGQGEGSYYIKIYNSLFEKFLGFKAFPGTLNLQVDELKAKKFLQTLEEIYIPEFKDQNRTFGGVKCFLAEIKKQKIAILIPDRTRYGPELLEIISPENLRKKFKLSEGKKITITKI